ncbi:MULTISPECIES: universal stress protein [unclassified Tenacibaculum]|uniref:universal stress protein n=1 Tax=unclassified Tenacibaculum TaxID=2635139 RepID=UPI001F39DDB6|nr:MULTISPECIES: universal stress protein [unclassified Tenacibaculum]MCF2875965.1 universal stress protein [Tenacibaculum sp. Cn5-1]MCF2936040.1 universal stress protein [Tenacibaculum sp. Cn5-34]MCG7512601.1 universal stress protein [Tenacibaculum sp. Cn5-46]
MAVPKHKIVVLSDLKDSTATSLKTAISLAKKTDASIHFFHVKKPTDVVVTDNQLSAKRAINSNFTQTNKEISELVSEFSQKYDIDITSSFTFGNIKNEIDLFLEDTNPNIIVIGKRRSKSISALGDKISKHVLKKKGKTIIIASAESELQPENEISLGLYNEIEQQHNNEFINEIIENANKPLKNFQVVNSNDANLLLVDREMVNPKSTKSFDKLLNKMNVSLVVAN